MKDSLEKANDELKRVDHLIYVSLKYTRTCDIFKSILERMISSIEFMLDALLINLQEQNKIEEIPQQPIAKSNIAKEHYDDEVIREMAGLLVRLRQINRAPFERAREFRRHVTMTVKLESEIIEINIDNITEYYKKIKDYYAYVNKMFGEEE
ncbi:hypothetical protein GF345_02215 [Candidatus Woesearchaeota archaeon]|nr:hypothetical protein [Candidatus Woesearchaeota archaeon]